MGHADEGADVVLEVVRGLRPVTDLESVGIYIRKTRGGYEIDNQRGVEVQARIRDVAEGLLRYRARIGDLRDGARVILMR